jgi:hypothetical protein
VLAAALATAGTAAADEAGDARYGLVHGCYALRPAGHDGLVAKAGDGYRAAGTPAQAEAFRLQATTLGRYLLYGRAADYLAAGDRDTAVTAGDGGPAADFEVRDAGTDTFTLTSLTGRQLASAPDGTITLTAPGAVDEAHRFTFVPAEHCAVFPEADINAAGEPGKGATPYSETAGFVDAHMHMMAFEFLGGDLHCGRPWDPYGITHALAACNRGPANNIASNVADTALEGPDRATADPVGWPTFKDWPAYNSLTHENSYYRWLERAWRGGLRVFVNLFVENHALCQAFPIKHNSCNEMASVRLQAKRLRQLQDYIDAQEGGPGKGWFRIVKDPFEARRVINDGKLAVVPGIEVSQLFDCGVYNDVNQCDTAQVDRELAAVYNELGVRDMELINKFDNGFGGVAGDTGTTGLIVNSGNKLETGKYWQMQKCSGSAEESDREQYTLPGIARDQLVGNLIDTFVPGGTLPAYPAGPHCNARGLTQLGEHLVNGMVDRGMIVDPDHLDVVSRKRLLDILEARGYSGVISSHSWSTSDAYPRIYRLGGIVTPYAGDSGTFVKAWREIKPKADKRFTFGFGYGADMNGFGAQGGPRHGDNPVTYPFTSFDGKVTFDRAHAGVRSWDISKDGVAHYGLYPDWIEDLRRIAGDEIVRDMARGSEAYLQMWERAVGVAPMACRSARLRFTTQGLGLLKLGAPAEELLRGAGQPSRRAARTWRYCVKGRSPAGRASAVFTPEGTVGLLVSTAPRHRVGGIGKGSRMAGSGTVTRAAGKGARFVYGVRRGRVRFAGVATSAVARNPVELQRYLRLAGLAP